MPALSWSWQRVEGCPVRAPLLKLTFLLLAGTLPAPPRFACLTTLSFQHPDRLWLAALLLAVGVGFLVWSYRRTSGHAGLRLGALLCKSTAWALLLTCLGDPVVSRPSPKIGENDVVLLADDSGSLSVAETAGGKPRSDAVQAALGRSGDARPDWMNELGLQFRLKLHALGTQLRSVKDFSELTFTATASRLEQALSTVSRSASVAAVVVITDGQPTDRGALKLAADARKVPFFPVLVGEQTPSPDLRLLETSVTQTAFEDTPVTITTRVEAVGYAGREVEVVVLDGEGKIAVRETARVTQSQESRTLRLKLPVAKPGVGFYRVQVREAGLVDLQSPKKEQSASREATLANNERHVKVDRGSGPYRVLYVAGRPNWDYKFMRRALAEDPEVQVPALIRIAKREPKFEWRGRTGESSNPLFRGFGDQANAQRYDQPVLIRLGTKDAKELADGFPKTAEQLFGEYRAILLDDVEAEFFSQEQMNLIERFVSERGGALLTLGGQECYQQGGYEGTPVGRMMPVYLDRTSSTPAVENARLELSREGWLEAWTRLRQDRAGDEQRLAQMPGFYAVNQTFSIKPGASVLATVRTPDDRSLPAWVAQRYGEGRVMSVLIADLWRWGMQDEAARRDFDKAWRQMLRALIVDVPDRLRVTTTADGDRMKIEVHLRDAAFLPQDDAMVRLEITTPEGKRSELFAEPSPKESGLYETDFYPSTPGPYRLEAQARLAPTEAKDATASAMESRRTGWGHDPLAAEFADLSPGRAWAEQMAHDSGGQVLSLADLPKLPELLKNIRVPVEETVTKPLWHSPWVFAALLMLLAGEWFLRRKGGLA